ncbi:MAG: hypothetical protein WBW92_04395, partial [Rhodanobacteraceae bacterium]
MYTMRHILCGLAIFALVSLLGACASMHSGAATAPAPAQPLARMTVPGDNADSRAMAALLQGEFALGDGDVPAASRAYARAA